MLPFLAGLWSSLRLMKAICGSYFVGLALTAWQSSSLKQSTAIHVPPIMKARSQVLRSQQSAMHMCMFFSSPRSLKFPAFIPPLRVTFFKIGLWVQWSSSWVDGSSTETEMWARNQNEKVVSLSCHFLPTPCPPLFWGINWLILKLFGLKGMLFYKRKRWRNPLNSVFFKCMFF